MSIDLVLTEPVTMTAGPRVAEAIDRRATELAARLRLPGLQATAELALVR